MIICVDGLVQAGRQLSARCGCERHGLEGRMDDACQHAAWFRQAPFPFTGKHEQILFKIKKWKSKQEDSALTAYVTSGQD